jgi:glycosidase
MLSLHKLSRLQDLRIKSSFMKMKAILFLLTFALPIYGCKKSDLEIGKVNPPTVNQDPEQYDVPFNKVPNTADIIMYEVNLRAFSNEGNLKGVQNRLDQIKDLGVNVVWLMPIHPIGVLKGIGSPYAIKDYKGVNTEFGNLEDLRTLVKEAHKRDMSVILDWVANHTAWDHPWIQSKAWYVQDSKGEIVSPNEWTDVAELNFDNQNMRKEMIKAMKYWVLAANVDGYRCDHTDGVPADFWKQAIDTLNNIPNRKLIMFAEGVRNDLFSSGFQLNFGWNFYSTLKDIYNKNQPASKLGEANTADYRNMQSNNHVLRFTSNHDDNAWDNTPISIFNGKQGSMAAFLLTSYMGGVPMIYNGQEVASPLKLSFFYKNPLDWSINPEITQEYKKIIALRKGSNAIKNGSINHYNNNNDVVAFKKTSGAEEILVLVNVRNQAVSYNVDQSLKSKQWQNAFDQTDYSVANAINLTPYSYIVLKSK